MMLCDSNRLVSDLSAAIEPRLLLYVDITPRLMTYIALYEELIKRNYKAFLVVDKKVNTSDLAEYLPIDAIIYEVEPEELMQLQSIAIFFASEAIKVEPPQAKSRVAILHSLPDAKGFRFDLAALLKGRPTICQYFDYLVLPTVPREDKDLTRKVEKTSDKVFPDSLINERTEFFCSIPGGYPKVDYLNRHIGNYERVRDCIVYAPTSIKQRRGKSRWSQQGRVIIKTLLDSFPDHKIVLRPYPGNELDISAVENEFGNNKLVVDSSSTGFVYQKRALTVVTDQSSFAVSHAFGSGDPVVFCDFSENGSRASSNGAESDWEGMGFFVGTSRALKNAVDACIYDREKYRSLVRIYRDQVLFNPCCSSSYIADQVPRLLGREPFEGYFKFKRRPFISKESGKIIEHIATLKSRWKKGTFWQRRAIDEIRKALWKL
jgi:hypothetical protein